MTKVNI